MRILIVISIIAGMAVALVAAEPHRRLTTSSGAARASLLELYTSEGCSSCPSADAWLAANAAELAALRVVPLALHVDYWNESGWVDRFSQAKFTQRQQAAASRSDGRIYTPEFVLDGAPVRRQDVASRVRSAAGTTTAIALELEATYVASDAVHLRAHLEGADRPTRLYIALQESALTVVVRAGENAGRTLRHDFVARRLEGPADNDVLDTDVRLGADWNKKKLGAVAFVEDRRTGEILQAVALALE